MKIAWFSAGVSLFVAAKLSEPDRIGMEVFPECSFMCVEIGGESE